MRCGFTWNIVMDHNKFWIGPDQRHWFSGSTSDAERIVFMLEWAKRFIMDQVRAEEA